jgi:hypothetical protein
MGVLTALSATMVQAAFDVSITNAAASVGGAWTGTNPRTWTASAPGATASIAEIQANLATASVIIDTGSTGTEPGDVLLLDPVAWAANTFTLKAKRNIRLYANLNGSVAAIAALRYGQVAAPVGNEDYFFAPGTTINLPEGNRFLQQRGTAGATVTYYVITTLGADGSVTAADLQGMNGNLSRAYALGADIDASATATWAGGLGFAPVGAASFFSGRFNGLNHAISSLTINRPTAAYAGLFAETRGEVRDVRFEGGSVSGLGFVGVLAGMTSGAITRVSSTTAVSNVQMPNTYPSALGGLIGFVNGGSVSHCVSSGSVTAINGGDDVGGVAGFNRFAVNGCYSTANVSGGSTVGGVVGYMQSGSISNSYASGSVTGTQYVGGLLGFNDSTVSTSYSTATVTGPAGQAGALVGFNRATLSNNYWNAALSGLTGSVGAGPSTGNTELTAMQLQRKGSFIGFDFTPATGMWRQYDNHTVPLLRALLTPVTVTADNQTQAFTSSATPVNPTNVSYAPASLAGSPLILGTTQPYAGAPYQPGSYLPDFWSTQSGYDLAFTNAVLSVTLAAPALDIDATGPAATAYQPYTDGLLAMRYMLGLRGSALVTGAIGPNPARDTGQIETQLGYLLSALDVDNNGSTDAATDGVLILRYLLGFRGSALINNAMGTCPANNIYCRLTANEIEAYLASLTP